MRLGELKSLTPAIPMVRKNRQILRDMMLLEM